MFLLFIDDYSRYTTVYLLRTKTDAASAFFHYEKKLFNMTGKHITILRSDGGGEYFTNSIKAYCDEHGITHQSSTPYTPQHNGRAERPNRTVVEGASAMLLDSKLSWEYWGYAVQTFVYLKNRSPHSSIYQSTPYEQWFKKVPNFRTSACIWLSMLRVHSAGKTHWSWF
jgi:transposase InsO family protein